jgi:peptidoglycan/xylan/chitin deacetylase (PgdA/CDA1 family)
MGLRRMFDAVDRLRPKRPGVTVLAYHRVGATTAVSVDLPTAQLAEQLDWLVEHARTIDLDSAADQLVSPGAAPAVVLTADDGTADWTETMLPLLVARGLPITWYVATRFVDEQRPFPDAGRPATWAALRDAVATGLVTIGSHTHSHAVMSRLDAATAAAELDRSIGLIQDHLGVECRHFAYPKALAPSEAADTEVRRRFHTAALAGSRVNVPGRTDPGRLGRTPIQRADDLARFALKVAGSGRTEGWARERYDRRRHRDATH